MLETNFNTLPVTVSKSYVQAPFKELQTKAKYRKTTAHFTQVWSSLCREYCTGCAQKQFTVFTGSVFKRKTKTDTIYLSFVKSLSSVVSSISNNVT